MFGLLCFLPDTVSSGEDPLVGDQSSSTGVSPLALSVVLQGNLKHAYSMNTINQFLSVSALKDYRHTCSSVLFSSTECNLTWHFQILFKNYPDLSVLYLYFDY